MHTWGDEDVDWEGISDAARYIGMGLRKWGRVGVRDFKEKFGTVRVYCSVGGWHQLHDITHPGHCYSRYPDWLWKLDCRYISRMMWLVNWLVVPYHVWLYKFLYRRAVQKWPHLRLEILSGADYTKLLAEHGVHHIRTGPNTYEIRYDWHPANWQPQKEAESDVEE